MNRIRLKAAVFLVAVGLYFALGMLQPGFLRFLNRWEAPQIVVLPLLYFCFFRLSIFKRQIPQSIMAAALLVVVIMAAISYSPSGPVMVAKFEGDDLDAQNKIVRDQLRHFSKADGGLPVRRFYRLLENQQQVNALFDASPELEAVVWGGAKWMTVSFPQRHLQTDLLGDHDEFGAWYDLSLVESPPSIALANRGDEATPEFLAALLSALISERKPEFNHAGEALASVNTQLQPKERLLIKASQTIGPWRSTVHRALPEFLLGNLYLKQQAQAAHFEQGIIDCALNAYRRALGHITDPRKNPELYAAVLNNLAVAHAVLFREKNQSKEFSMALRMTKLSRKFLKLLPEHGKGSETRSVNSRNLKLLKIQAKKLGLARHSRKHRQSQGRQRRLKKQS